jgi:hypothetical protein
MSGGFRTGRLGSCLGRAARAICAVLLAGALAIFFVASVAQATVSGATGLFTASDAPPDAATAMTTEANSVIVRLSGVEASPTAAAQNTSLSEPPLADRTGAASYIPDAGAVLEIAPQTNLDGMEIFDVYPGQITERDAGLDVLQMVLTAAEGNPAFSERNPRVRNTAALDLVANGLGPTTITRRGAGRFGSGLDLSLLRIFLVLVGTVVAGVALARWKLT